MQKTEKLYPGCYYHIYNRGNNREDIFFEKQNYFYFLELYTRYIESIADTFAYCLNVNHFHFLVRIKEILQGKKTSKVLETSEVLNLSQPFSNLFNAYAKAINKRYHRTGSLFQTRFGRKRITNEAYLVQVIQYIHFNPQKHGLVNNFRNYPFSSYRSFLSEKSSHLKREEVLEWVNGIDQFVEFHKKAPFQDYGQIGDIFEKDD